MWKEVAIWIFIVISAIWVFYDAKSIGVRKGLITGLGNMNPIGWFFAVLLLCALSLPLYLMKRGTFKKETGRPGLTLAWLAFGFIMGLLVVASPSSNPSSSSNSQQSSVENKITSQFSSWNGEHRNLTKYIKYNMKDPGSYEHVETRFSTGSDLIVITRYRGKNSFGAYNVDTVKARIDINTGGILEIM
ncbi:MAG: hypothetical protein KAT04_15775 [Methylococcales bacterium]|nr:hypothetical protein [Methylococcales bacterium]